MISNNDILNARVMVVDDNQANVNLLEKTLSSAGYTSVLCITDSRETIELYKSFQPDLILLDINMPYLNGYQIMEQLKETGKDDYVPILVLTALQDKDTRIKSLESGARDFLTKPFDQTEVLVRIRNMLENRLLHDRIQKQNVVLEQKVQERTVKLTEAHKELEEFVYIISHDLKEPLFSIEGYRSRLLRLYEDTFTGKGKIYINRIKANIEIMSQKIQNIMDVLVVGRVEYNFKDNDSKAIVRNVVEMLEGAIGSNKIDISIQDNLPVVPCDEQKMKDLFSNLIANAIKFMGNNNSTTSPFANPTHNPPFIKGGEGGIYQRDCVGLRHIKIGCDKNGKYYKFFVEDTGIGIKEEYKELIFKIFRRLNDIEAEGTGVGLVIVKKIIEMHEGKIWVESPVKNGRGSRFCFTIPMVGSNITDS